MASRGERRVERAGRGRRLACALGAGGALLASLAACGPARPGPTTTPSTATATAEQPTAWAATLDSVQALLAVHRHAAADSLLQRFAVSHAGTPAGAEATFWRALVALDPANDSSSPRDALVAIDGYLAGGIDQPRYAEALLLRRTAGVLENARSAPIPTLRVMTLPADSLIRLRAAQDTIRQLRSELERTQAELERIRRRIRP